MLAPGKVPNTPPGLLGNNSMSSNWDIEHYKRILDGLEPGTIDRYDREESGLQCFGHDEYSQSDGYFSFGALGREDQAEILRTLDMFLPSRNKRVNYRTGTSYAIKHAVERFRGSYTSNLQVKTGMRILNYERGGDDLNPNYNISRREWRVFDEYSRIVADRRSEKKRRLSSM